MPIKKKLKFSEFKGFIQTAEEVSSKIKTGEAITLSEVLTYKNKNQIDERNFIALRIFSK